MKQIRLEVRRRTLFLDLRDIVFIEEDGKEIHKTDTEGVIRRIQRYVNRRLRGVARVHGRAQLLQALRQFNSPKEGYTQFVVVEEHHVEKLARLDGIKHEYALDEAIVKAIQARRPVDLLAMERWAKDHGWYVGLSGKNQVLGGKVRLVREGMRSDFPPEKLVARSLLDKPEAFRGEAIYLLVCDYPFVDAVTGDGAFLLKASAPRHVTRTVTQRVRLALEYFARDAKRGEPYFSSEFTEKVARYDTEMLDVREDGDLVHLTKRESARIDTGAKLVHELGFKGTAVVVERLPEPIEREWPQIHGVVNSSCIKSNALLSAHAQECRYAATCEKGWILRLPVRMVFTGHERMSDRGNRVSTNVLSTLHSVSPAVMDRMIDSRIDESPGSIVHGLLWWAGHIEGPGSPSTNGLGSLPVIPKTALKMHWGDHLERRFAFGDLADHPLLDPDANPKGFIATGRGGNQFLVPSARLLLASLGKVEVEGEPGYHFPDYVNTLLQVIRCLDISPKRFAKVRAQLRQNVLGAANRTIRSHSIRVPGIHGVLIAVPGLGDQVVVPNRFGHFVGTIHREPLLGRDGVRRANVLPLGMARDLPHAHPGVDYLLRNLVAEDFEVVLADFERLTRQNGDNDGDLVYLSRLPGTGKHVQHMDRVADNVTPFVDPEDRFGDLSRGFEKLEGDHDPYDLEPDVVQRAVLETAASARDVGSITWFAYVVREAVIAAERFDLHTVMARVTQAYIDGLKNRHQTSANLFACLMRVWSRMAVPCLAVRNETGDVIGVRLSPSVHRELIRARYVEGEDFIGEIAIPHPTLVEEAYRKIKKPLVGILEGILLDLEEQNLATRHEMKAIRDVLENQYGRYPRLGTDNRDDLVRDRRIRYGAVQRLYGMRPIRSLKDLATLEVRPLWAKLMALSTQAEDGVLDHRAEEAVLHGKRAEQLVVL